MAEIYATGRSGGAASSAPANDLTEVGHRESPFPARNNPFECPTGSALNPPDLATLRDQLKSAGKREPAEVQPHVRNVLATLDRVLNKRTPACEVNAAKAQVLRNIDMLERVRREDVA